MGNRGENARRRRRSSRRSHRGYRSRRRGTGRDRERIARWDVCERNSISTRSRSSALGPERRTESETHADCFQMDCSSFPFPDVETDPNDVGGADARPSSAAWSVVSGWILPNKSTGFEYDISPKWTRTTFRTLISTCFRSDFVTALLRAGVGSDWIALATFCGKLKNLGCRTKGP